MTITINKIKWMDEECKDIKKGVPKSLSVLATYLPKPIELTKDGITEDSVDSITRYLYDRFGAFPSTMDIQVFEASND